jgi:hypothetical protein
VHGDTIVDRDSGCDEAQQAMMGFPDVETRQKGSENVALCGYRFGMVVRKGLQGELDESKSISLVRKEIVGVEGGRRAWDQTQRERNGTLSSKQERRRATKCVLTSSRLPYAAPAALRAMKLRWPVRTTADEQLGWRFGPPPKGVIALLDKKRCCCADGQARSVSFPCLMDKE